MKVALFATCIADSMFPQAPQATMRLLERLGITVDFPQSQACCGQMHINTGYYPEAMPLIKNHVDTFSPVLDGEWDAIVVPSGSCTGSIRHQQEMVAKAEGFDGLARTAADIAAKTYELSEFLVDVLGKTDVGAYFPHRVTYHPTCHSLRVARVGDRPYQLLREVQGIDLVDLPEAESCCGFGGTFSLKNAETSASMLADKMTNIKSTGAEVLVAGDYSCLMHIAGGLARNRAGVRAMHLAEVLAGTQDQPWVAPSNTVKAGV
ncbi:L-lactate dehydrogenase complex protein LldE [Arcanobacterium pluranimalium]|uniref:(Fe-S)-binding protein n=1 Tax=Arcanobacterium pluranimalium TaxID=108028 RepID=UPI001956F1AC|nr:(Fe-S)-binding protein [Arcanobacterium pluranimalium]MBM7825518.1 L-lactate dehydrogenase complex protein LldE [Arcanobacterium pluranimalium]